MQTTKTVEAAEVDFLPVPREAPAPSLPAVLPEAATVLNIIERAARDPSVDIDKMERLILMQERIQGRQAQIEYDGAMQAAQSKMERIRADANNPQTRSMYATYAQIDRALRPIYTESGFSLSFDTGDGAPVDCVRIVCCVAHVGGHRQHPHIDMPADGKGAKGGDVMTKTHATGAAVTYGKRYLLGMIFNIAIGRDDDGNGATMGAAGTAGSGGQFRPERRGGDMVDEARAINAEQTKARLAAGQPPLRKAKPSRSEWTRYQVEDLGCITSTEELWVFLGDPDRKAIWDKFHEENHSLWLQLEEAKDKAKVRLEAVGA